MSPGLCLCQSNLQKAWATWSMPPSPKTQLQCHLLSEALPACPSHPVALPVCTQAWSLGTVILMLVAAHDSLAISLGQTLADFTSGPDRATPGMDAKEQSLDLGMVLKLQQSWTFC